MFTLLEVLQHSGVPFNSEDTWEQMEYNKLSPKEQEHITEAWKVDSEAKHVDSLLDNEWLLACGFIPKISHRRKVSRKSQEKNAGESNRCKRPGESCRGFKKAKKECPEVQSGNNCSLGGLS
ncbi:hypothetical protein ACOSP7_016831 [Xanthoceras sorbifolium]